MLVRGMKKERECVMDLPNDIIEELLMRLPLISITRFKCVSKVWNHFISDTHFRSRYQSRHNTIARPSGFLYHEQNPDFYTAMPCMRGTGPAKFINTSNIETEELKFSFDYLLEFGFVVASSKGLLLLSRNPMCYYVYDLLTQKHVMLPKPCKKHDHVSLGFICKEREQNFPNNGGHSSYLAYKVVRVGTPLVFIQSTTHKVETYSSEIGKWHKSMMTAASEFSMGPHFTAKAIRGVLHWLEYGGKRIIAYDPEEAEGRAKLIELPSDEDVDVYSDKGFMGTQDGCLQYINVYYHIDVYILRSKHEGGSYLDEDVIDGGRWNLFHKISFVELGLGRSDFGPGRCVCYAFIIDINPQDSSIIFLHTPNEVLSYNLDHKTIRVITTKRKGGGRRYNEEKFIHFEWPSWPCL